MIEGDNHYRLWRQHLAFLERFTTQPNGAGTGVNAVGSPVPRRHSHHGNSAAVNQDWRYDIIHGIGDRRRKSMPSQGDGSDGEGRGGGIRAGRDLHLWSPQRTWTKVSTLLKHPSANSLQSQLLSSSSSSSSASSSPYCFPPGSPQMFREAFKRTMRVQSPVLTSTSEKVQLDPKQLSHPKEMMTKNGLQVDGRLKEKNEARIETGMATAAADEENERNTVGDDDGGDGNGSEGFKRFSFLPSPAPPPPPLMKREPISEEPMEEEEMEAEEEEEEEGEEEKEGEEGEGKDDDVENASLPKGKTIDVSHYKPGQYVVTEGSIRPSFPRETVITAHDISLMTASLKALTPLEIQSQLYMGTRQQTRRRRQSRRRSHNVIIASSSAVVSADTAVARAGVGAQPVLHNHSVYRAPPVPILREGSSMIGLGLTSMNASANSIRTSTMGVNDHKTTKQSVSVSVGANERPLPAHYYLPPSAFRTAADVAAEEREELERKQRQQQRQQEKKMEETDEFLIFSPSLP
ncbi:hypothetical protein BX616_003538 [Lobosporangium transversale]|nr:hypothetical protein BX616_003538 [Lobosporangium transversale]